MEYQDWIRKVAATLKATKSGHNIKGIPPAVLTDAFTNGVSPIVFVKDYVSQVAVPRRRKWRLPGRTPLLLTILGALAFLWIEIAVLREAKAREELDVRKWDTVLPVPTVLGPFMPPEALEAQKAVETLICDKTLNPALAKCQNIQARVIGRDYSKFEFTGQVRTINDAGTPVVADWLVAVQRRRSTQVVTGLGGPRVEVEKRWEETDVKLSAAGREVIWRDANPESGSPQFLAPPTKRKR